MKRLIVASGLLAILACGQSPVERVESSRGGIAPDFAALGPSLAPAAQLVELRLTGEHDTIITGLPGDTVVILDLEPGEYQLAMAGLVSAFIVWKSGPQRVIVLPGTLSEPTITPVAFEVADLVTTSTLPLTVGTPLDIDWSPLPAAVEYRIAWSATQDFGTIIRDTVVADDDASLDLGSAGTYFVRVSPVDSVGGLGYPLLLPDTVVVQN